MASAGAANVISGHPFDTVKVIMQGNPRDHKNAISAARHVVSTSGTLGLYRGMTSPLIGGALETAVNYGVRISDLASLSRKTIEMWSQCSGSYAQGACQLSRRTI